MGSWLIVAQRREDSPDGQPTRRDGPTHVGLLHRVMIVNCIGNCERRNGEGKETDWPTFGAVSAAAATATGEE